VSRCGVDGTGCRVPGEAWSGVDLLHFPLGAGDRDPAWLRLVQHRDLHLDVVTGDRRPPLVRGACRSSVGGVVLPFQQLVQVGSIHA
jgi:hypothetical protein